MTMYMETTKIKAIKTISEIQSLLVKAGAEKIMIDYNGGEPVSLVFSINYLNNSIGYKLPCKMDNIFQYLQEKRAYPGDYTDRDHEQSVRVAWRQILRWIQAQFALLDVGMVDIKEIFLPYFLMGNKRFTRP